MCCPKGSWPALEPDNTNNVGSVASLPTAGGGSAQAYVTGDRKSSRAILLLPDIYDFAGGRTRACADTLAAVGYLVVHPSFFREAPPDPSDFAKFVEWLKLYPYDTHCRPIVSAALEFLSTQGASSIFLAGFCWGCWVSARVLADSELLHCRNVRGAVYFHPSLRIETIVGGDDAALVARSRVPHIFITAANDEENIRPGGAVVMALQARSETAKSRSIEFADMRHGWVPRGDVTDPDVRRDVRLAIEAALSWMKEIEQ